MNKYIKDDIELQQVEYVDFGKGIDAINKMARWRYPKRFIGHKLINHVWCPVCGRVHSRGYVDIGCYCLNCGQALLGVNWMVE